MKKIIAILLVFALQIPIFSKWGTIAVFQINQSEIIENFCVNKDRPELNCDGHCYLAKQLKSLEEKEKKANSERISHNPTLDLIDQINFYSFQFQYLELPNNIDFIYENQYKFQKNHLIKAPPELV